MIKNRSNLAKKLRNLTFFYFVMDNRYVVSSIFLATLLVIFVPRLSGATVPSIFIFGDSTADVGTNALIPDAKARADLPFNGIDFPNSRPTGRFSNGFNSADYLAKLMGFKRSPQPFLFLQSLKSGLQRPKFRGVNFASGGSGLLDVTGKTLNVVSLSEQIKQFEMVRSNLTVLRGSKSTEELLSKSIFTISIGSNDIFGYFLINSTVPKEKFIGTLMEAYNSHIMALYRLGARKFGIISVPPTGCCPSQRVFNSTGGCLEMVNDFSRAFYSELSALMWELEYVLPGMKYSLGNAYEMTINVIENPHLFKFKELATACCGSGKFNAINPCTPSANLCSNRDEYLFWDLYHPTQAAARLAAQTLYGGPQIFVSPINFSQLAQDF